MLQNHLLQLLCLVAMEPPAQFEAEAVRDEKVKVLRALKPICGQDVQDKTVRGQYGAGHIDGQAVPAYYFEKDVDNDSDTETFVAVRARRRQLALGRACRSTCAPASAWRAARRRSSFSSSPCRMSCSTAARSTSC